jgi:dihydroflavonol-4-reductase
MLADLNIHYEIGDISDIEIVNRAIKDQQVVIHAAYDRQRTQPSARVEYAADSVNLDGARNVVAACEGHRVRRLLYVSSVAAIGIPEDSAPPAGEDFKFSLENSVLDYHRSKRQTEEIVLAAVSRGLDAVVVNPGSIFGPFGMRYRGMELIEQVRAASILPYFSGGICTVHVTDVVDGIIAALDRGVAGNRYILGGENVTYRDLFRRAADAIHVRRLLVPVPPPVSRLAALLLEPWARLRKKTPGITSAAHYFAHRHHFYDSTKARLQLSYAPRSFQAILDECVRFLEQSPAQSERRIYEPNTA